MNGTVLASTATTAAWPQIARSRGSGGRVSTHITSSVSAPRAHRANATPRRRDARIQRDLDQREAGARDGREEHEARQPARDERACDRAIGTALASGRDRRVGAGATWAQVVTAA